MARNEGNSIIKKAGVLSLGLIGIAGVASIGKWLIGRAARQTISKFMTEPYDKNLWEVFSAGARATPQVIMEANLRAEEGTVIKRPLGGPKNFPDFSRLMFNVAQLSRMPVSELVPVKTSVVLGKRAAKPLRLEIPILISGMAYGFILSEQAKIALARGAALAGTATNTGQGPFLPSERKAAKHLILQYNRGNWSKSPEILQQADMVEIQLGHAARAGTGDVVKTKKIDSELRKHLGLASNQDAVSHAKMPGVNKPEDLAGLVAQIRNITGGVPVGVKIAAGNSLEEDLFFIVEAGADFITIDGAPGGSGGTPPILQDDCGLPTFFALCRAVKFLEKLGVRGSVELIVSGGLKTPGDYLKALALGADAVAIGSIALFAMSHTQVLEALPFEPPIQVVYQNGTYKDRFDVAKGAKNLANYLISCTEEMKEAVRALGKTDISQLAKEDLFALDQESAEVAGVPYGGSYRKKIRYTGIFH